MHLLLLLRRIPARTPFSQSSTITAATTPPIRLSSTSTALPAPSPPSTTTTTTPPSNQTNHHDLPSFLTYATQSNLARNSTLFIGTHYEYTTQRSLAQYGLALTRIGGRSDCGIDLIGHWHLPRSILSDPLKVLVQCKALQHRRPGPHLVRELEGAFAGAPHGFRGPPSTALGILCAPREATKGVREALGRSRWPLAFVMLGLSEGRVTQFLWNRAAMDLGLSEVGVTLRYNAGGGTIRVEEGEMDGESQRGQVEVRGEVALTFRGEVIRDLAVGVGVDGREE